MCLKCELKYLCIFMISVLMKAVSCTKTREKYGNLESNSAWSDEDCKFLTRLRNSYLVKSGPILGSVKTVGRIGYAISVTFSARRRVLAL